MKIIGDSVLDVVFTLASGFHAWDVYRPFVNSISKSEINCKKVVFERDMSGDVKNQFRKAGFEVVSYMPRKPKYGHFGTERYEPLSDYLKKFDDKYRYLLITDCRDVVFQSNPFLWLEKNLGLYKIVGCSECLYIKDEYYNYNWLKNAAADDPDFERMKDKEILCAGTVVGEYEFVRKLSLSMAEMLDRDSSIVDQGALNYFLRKPPFEEATRVVRMCEGFVASVNWFIQKQHSMLEECPVMKEDGLVYPANGKEPFCILHQYDRDPVWKNLIEKKYRE